MANNPSRAATPEPMPDRAPGWTDRAYRRVYSPLVAEFVAMTAQVNSVGVTALHLPCCCAGYETALPRVVIVGEQTDGWGRMDEFLAVARDDPCNPKLFERPYVEDLDFLERTTNFGNSFWDTVLRLVALFNGVEDWRCLKRGSHPGLLGSFVWANSNALEAYHITARRLGAANSDWARFKEASYKLDFCQHLVDVYEPHVMAVMNWDAHAAYFSPDLQWDHLRDHVRYVWNTASETHIFHFAHPTWLRFHGYEDAMARIAEKWHGVRCPRH